MSDDVIRLEMANNNNNNSNSTKRRTKRKQKKSRRSENGQEGAMSSQRAFETNHNAEDDEGVRQYRDDDYADTMESQANHIQSVEKMLTELDMFPSDEERHQGEFEESYWQHTRRYSNENKMKMSGKKYDGNDELDMFPVKEPETTAQTTQEAEDIGKKKSKKKKRKKTLKEKPDEKDVEKSRTAQPQVLQSQRAPQERLSVKKYSAGFQHKQGREADGGSVVIDNAKQKNHERTQEAPENNGGVTGTSVHHGGVDDDGADGVPPAPMLVNSSSVYPPPQVGAVFVPGPEYGLRQSSNSVSRSDSSPEHGDDDAEQQQQQSQPVADGQVEPTVLIPSATLVDESITRAVVLTREDEQSSRNTLSSDKDDKGNWPSVKDQRTRGSVCIIFTLFLGLLCLGAGLGVMALNTRKGSGSNRNDGAIAIATTTPTALRTQSPTEAPTPQPTLQPSLMPSTTKPSLPPSTYEPSLTPTLMPFEYDDTVGCSICGEGRRTSKPDGKFSFAGFTSSCRRVERNGLLGYIPKDECLVLASFLESCGCAEMTESPTAGPTHTASPSDTETVASREFCLVCGEDGSIGSPDNLAFDGSDITCRGVEEEGLPAGFPCVGLEERCDCMYEISILTQTPMAPIAVPTFLPVSSPIIAGPPPIETSSPTLTTMPSVSGTVPNFSIYIPSPTVPTPAGPLLPSTVVPTAAPIADPQPTATVSDFVPTTGSPSITAVPTFGSVTIVPSVSSPSLHVDEGTVAGGSEMTEATTLSPSASPSEMVVTTCHICGDGFKVGNMTGVWHHPDNTPAICWELQIAGHAGLIPPELCSELPSLLTACECAEV